MERPGIVDLRDLASRYAWHPRAIDRFVEAAGLAVGGATSRQFAPPRVVLAIVPHLEAHMLRRARLWLADAARIVIVRDRSGDLDIADDSILVEINDTDWREVLAELPPAEVFDWFADDAPCRDAVRQAIAACASLEPTSAVPGHSHAQPELPVGSWTAYETGADHDWRGLASFAAQLATRDDDALLDVDAAGGSVHLAALPARVQVSSRELRDQGPSIADRQAARFEDPGHVPLGFDPIHPIGWRGDRMSFYWSYVGHRGTGFLSASDHDYPCGPAKKLYGYADNDPIQIVLAPSADICVARFEHDVLVTSAVPIPWHRAGDVDVAAFTRDPRRAVFFAQDLDSPGPRDPDIELLEEDARDFAPAIVLGPDAAIRYAVDLTFRVHRIMRPADSARDAEIVHVGGPGEGYAVFDADHRLVRRGVGQLIGGWFRWATIEDDGFYWREDLATGERIKLAPVDFSVCDDPETEAIARDAIAVGRHELATQIRTTHPSHDVKPAIGALAIPATRNVLLVGRRHLRVV